MCPCGSRIVIILFVSLVHLPCIFFVISFSCFFLNWSPQQTKKKNLSQNLTPAAKHIWGLVGRWLCRCVCRVEKFRIAYEQRINLRALKLSQAKCDWIDGARARQSQNYHHAHTNKSDGIFSLQLLRRRKRWIYAFALFMNGNWYKYEETEIQ